MDHKMLIVQKVNKDTDLEKNFWILLNIFPGWR